MDGGEVHVEFTQRLNDSRLEYVLELSKDLVTWNSGSEFLEGVALSESLENSGRVRFRVLDSSGGHCFVRVLVNLKD